MTERQFILYTWPSVGMDGAGTIVQSRLFLDDLGAHRVTDWVEDTVTSLITYRYNQNKPLITTTNLRDSEAGDAPAAGAASGDLTSRYYLTERIGSRARSRLFEMCRTISTRGVEDYRVRKNR